MKPIRDIPLMLVQLIISYLLIMKTNLYVELVWFGSFADI